MSGRRVRGVLAAGALVVGAFVPAACDSGDDESDLSLVGADGEQFPDIVAVEATRADDGTWSFFVTISSPYDTPERYADGWRVEGPDGEVYGEHTLTHDHANEQPFARSQSGVTIPHDVEDVTVTGHDLVNGYGGGSVTITLDRD